jgi:hypothetical protein
MPVKGSDCQGKEVMPMRYSRAILYALAAIATLWRVDASAAVDGADRLVVHQLRIYQIFDNNKREFHERFRDHAMRIMARYGFEIVAMWEANGEGGPEFAYLLEWPDEVTMRDRWEKFMADEEWAEIKRVTAAKHGQLVGEIQDRTLKATEYSPERVFLRRGE